MAYTNVPWNNSNPPNSQAANTAAAEYRKIKLDLYERLTTVFNNIDTDPLVFKASFITYLNTLIASVGSKAYLPQIINPHEGGPASSDMEYNGGSIDGGTFTGYVTPAAISSDLDWVIDLSRFAGLTPATYSADVSRAAGATITLTLYRLVGATLTLISTVAVAAVGSTTATLSGQTTLIDPTVGSFFLLVHMVSDGLTAASAQLRHIAIDD